MRQSNFQNEITQGMHPNVTFNIFQKEKNGFLSIAKNLEDVSST